MFPTSDFSTRKRKQEGDDEDEDKRKRKERWSSKKNAEGSIHVIDRLLLHPFLSHFMATRDILACHHQR